MDPRLLSVSLWRNRYPHLWSFICPLCKAPRRVPFRPKPGPREFFQVFLTALVFTLLTWGWLHWKGLVSFVPFWIVYEVIYRCRMRAALYCSQCGFDPYLFMIDDHLARREVDTHWRQKFADKGIPYPEKPTLKQPAPKGKKAESNPLQNSLESQPEKSP